MSEQKVPKDVDKYQEHYSEPKFWDKAKLLGKNVLKPSVLLYYLLKSPEVPFSTKAKITGALGYLILPLDLIPDLSPIIGYTDDLAALIAVIKMCDAYITPQIKAEADAKLNELMGIKP